MRYSRPQISMSSCNPLSKSEKAKITRLRRKLLGWYDENGRDFPWRREEAGTFEKICVEVLLQRTKAETVAAAYPKFFKKYNSWSQIANASIAELEETLKPLGLWKRRAQSIKMLATYAHEHRGVFPATKEELLKVTAVGQYVCNAILLFQHGKARPLIDVNMARVIERYLRPRKLADIRYDPWLQAATLWLVSDKKAINVNWAVLDFANSICRSKKPRCCICILNKSCSYRKRTILEEPI